MYCPSSFSAYWPISILISETSWLEHCLGHLIQVLRSKLSRVRSPLLPRVMYDHPTFNKVQYSGFQIWKLPPSKWTYLREHWPVGGLENQSQSPPIENCLGWMFGVIFGWPRQDLLCTRGYPLGRVCRILLYTHMLYVYNKIFFLVNIYVCVLYTHMSCIPE